MVSLCLTSLFVFERVLHAFVWLIVSFVVRPVLADKAAMAMASRGLLVRLIDVLIDVTRYTTSALGGLLQWALYYVPMVLIFLMVMFFLQILSDSQPQFVMESLRMWNDGTSTVVRSVIIVPLELLNLLYQIFIPFWNVVHYFFKGLTSRVMLPILQLNTTALSNALRALADTFRALANSAVAYSNTVGACDSTTCLSFGYRIFDVLSPMIHFRVMVANVLIIARGTCNVMSPVFDLIAYPLLDTNFAQGLHAAINAPLYAVVQLPLVTMARCAQASTDTDSRVKALSCTPDVAPIFNLASASVRYFGHLLDNWLDVTWVTVLSAFGHQLEKCNPSPVAMSFVDEQTVFGGEETRLVGLGGSAYALTDGKSVQYTFFRGTPEKVFAQDQWSFPIQVAYGIAAIQYDEGELVDDDGYKTMSMLGCICQDVKDTSVTQGSRMQIHCNIARYQSEDADEALDPNGLHVPVDFALPSTAAYMTCAGSKIVVDSVRWPVSRLSTPGSLGSGGRNFRNPLSDLASDDGTDNPEEADATIWIMPACKAEGKFDPVCSRDFKESACFPYCMAVRPRGSQSQGLMLYNADDWSRTVQLQRREFGGASLDANSLVSAFTDNADYVSSAPAGTVATIIDRTDPMGRVIAVNKASSEYDPASMTCVSADKINSRVNRSASADLYERYESITLPGQPFAMTGSVALVPVVIEGKTFVKVQRLYGEQGSDSFTVVTTHSKLPAIAPCVTMSDCDKLPSEKLVSIPYSWSASPARHNPAVETRWGVYYAVNPSLDMFKQFSLWCQLDAPKLQVQAESTYGGIRIWRVDAFEMTTPDRTDSTGVSVEMPDVYLSRTDDSSICGSAFNVIVTSMEYINENNIAVQVMRAAPAYLDFTTFKPLSGDMQKVTYVTYFLHPVTMQIQMHQLWLADTAVTQLSMGASVLCPEWRNMPQFGSVIAETGAAVLLASRMFVTFLISAPTVFQPDIFQRLRECPFVHREHSMLLNCGRNFLSLDNAFDAMRAANTHYWNSLTKLGRILSGLPQGDSMSSTLQGIAMTEAPGSSKLMRPRSPTGVAASSQGRIHDFALNQYKTLLSKLGNLPSEAIDMLKQVGEKSTKLAQQMIAESKEFLSNPNGFKTGTQLLTAPPGGFIRRLPGASIGMSAFGGSMIDMSQFFWRTITRLLLELISKQKSQALVSVLWEALSDSMEDFTTFLVKPGFRVCSGLGVMLGGTNPWAKLVRESCSASVAMQQSTITAAEVMFVQVPVMACLCRDTEGKNFKEFVTANCLQYAPTNMRPLIASMISGITVQKTVCSEMSLTVEDNLRAVLNPALQHAHAATSAVASFVDYATILFDPEAGKCDDFLYSPYTMAIVPEPIDYFRSCGKTQSCKARCLTLFDEFEAARLRFKNKDRTVEIKNNVHRNFFSKQDVLDGKAAPPFQILAMLEIAVNEVRIETNTMCCGLIADGGISKDKCIAVAGVNAATELAVVEYCVPSRLDVGVYEHARWTVTDSSTWTSSMRAVKFASREHLVVTFGDRVDMYRKDGSRSALLQVNIPGVEAAAFSSNLHRITSVFVAPSSYIIINGFQNRNSEQHSVHSSVCINLINSVWPFFYGTYCSSNLYLHTTQHIPTCIGSGCHQILMLPTSQQSTMRHCQKDTYEQTSNFDFTCIDAKPDPSLALKLGFEQRDGVQFITTSDVTTMRRIPSLSQNMLDTNSCNGLQHIFSSNPSSSSVMWMQEVSVSWVCPKSFEDKTNALVSKSMSRNIPVSMEIQLTCSVENCNGCKSPVVYRACYAAQQCSLARCIGTVVNLERPLCSVGRLLQVGLDVDLVKLHGVWTILIDLVIFILRSATGQQQSAIELQFIDEVFFSLICEAKNGIIASMSIITSLVNGIMNNAGRERARQQAVHSNIVVDEDAANAEAVRTLTAAATTNFLSQLSLGILYVPIVMKKTLMCHTDAFLSVLDIGGFKLRLQSKKYTEATNVMTGRCLSQYVEESMQQPTSAESGEGFAKVMEDMVVDGGTAMMQIPFERMLHVFDASFSYGLGILSGMKDLIATADQMHCNLPDVEANDIAKCACGDTAAAVPFNRATEGVKEGAFWCTGVLSLMSSVGKSYLAVNPYTYQELITEMAGQDDFLTCISQSNEHCEERRPGKNLHHLFTQGVSPFTVLTRCKSNYANSQWDEGAAALFAETIPTNIAVNVDLLENMRGKAFGSGTSLSSSLISCMALALYDEQSNDICLQDFLTRRDIRRQVYFQYRDTASGETGSENIAACQVFTGPAKNSNENMAAKFKACTGTSSEMCDMPPIVWAGRSENRVPVASQHAMASINYDQVFATAEKMHAETMATVANALEEIKNWDADHLELSLFTSEGDSLHQLFDALILGPYGRANMWPNNNMQSLPTSAWFRDTKNGQTREFELPCMGEALRNQTSSPFTCGSAARRGVIRYFVNDVFSGVQKDTLRKAVKSAVDALRVSLTETWISHSTEVYGCSCDDGQHKVNCCTDTDPSMFLPASLYETPYTELDSSDLVEALFTAIGTFVENDLWTNTALPFVKYNTDFKKDEPFWDEFEREGARKIGMFRTDNPLMSYSDEEVNIPYGPNQNVSMWRMCHGMLQQTLATMPMGEHGLPIGVLKNVVYDPLKSASGDAVHALETFVKQATAESWRQSPLHHSHVMRHLPSDSIICESFYMSDDGKNLSSNVDEVVYSKPISREYIGGTDVLGNDFVLGDVGHIHHQAGGLGAARYACLCGWVDSTGNCYLPQLVCGISWIDVSTFLTTACRQLSDADPTSDPIFVPRPGLSREGDRIRDTVIENWNSDLVCDSMIPSESWGILNESSMHAWLNGDKDENVSFGVREILEAGRSGLRIGSIQNLINKKSWAKLLSPGSRRSSTSSAFEQTDRQHKMGVGQKWCAQNYTEELPASFANHFVEELFPMAQGVLESSPVAFCLRVVVEAARLRVLQLMSDTVTSEVADRLHLLILEQEAVLADWRQKCLYQVDMVSICALRGVFSVHPHNEPVVQCPFSMDIPENLIFGFTGDASVEHAWITPSCLLRWKDGKHYYPCQCRECNEEAITLDITDITNDPDCEVDVTALLLPAQSRETSSLFWPSDYTHNQLESNRKDLAEQASVIRRQRMQKQVGLNVDLLLESYVRDTGEPKQKFGNTEKNWYSAEGLAHEGSTSFCDLIHDWWPDEWTHPVGLHVTTPCHQNDISYRGFDSSFVVDKEYTPPRFIFQNDAVHNTAKKREGFGASGVCRLRSFAMPQQNLNNMRFCTQMYNDAQADPAVPVKPIYQLDSTGNWLVKEGTTESCAPTQFGVPHDILQLAPGKMWKSAGVVMDWPTYEDHWASYMWPPVVQDFLSRPEEIGISGWGSDGCGLPKLLTCVTDKDCKADIAGNDAPEMKCMQWQSNDIGVCMVVGNIECVNHKDCGDFKMCAGDGICVDPVVSFSNERKTSSSIEMHLLSESCAETERDETYGTSPWENVPDILRSNGFCSHRKWYEYRNLLERRDCTWDDNNPHSSCIVNADQEHWLNTKYFGDNQQAPDTTHSLRDDNILRMEAHVCDRDFQHMTGYAECTPNTVLRRNVQGKIIQHSHENGFESYGRSFATYTTPHNATIPFTINPFLDNKQVGFLGTNLDLQVDGMDKLKLLACADVAHCAMQPFTIRGNNIAKRFLKRTYKQALREYKLKDAVKCGAFGYIHRISDNIIHCRVDVEVVPFYKIVCTQRNELDTCSFKIAYDSSLCLSLKSEYLTSETTAMAKKVNGLMHHLNAWSSDDASSSSMFTYHQQVECAIDVLKLMQTSNADVEYETEDGGKIGSIGLYYFTDFALYEITPLWWVKCVLFSVGITPGQEPLECRAYSGQFSEVSAMTAHNWLAVNVGRITQKTMDTTKHDLLDRMSVVFDEVIDGFMDDNPNVDRSTLFNEECFQELNFNMDLITGADTDSITKANVLKFLRDQGGKILDQKSHQIDWTTDDCEGCANMENPTIHKEGHKVLNLLREAFMNYAQLDIGQNQDTNYDIKNVEVKSESMAQLIKVQNMDPKSTHVKSVKTSIRTFMEIEKDDACSYDKIDKEENIGTCIYENAIKDYEATSNPDTLWAWSTRKENIRMEAIFSKSKIGNIAELGGSHDNSWFSIDTDTVGFDVCGEPFKTSLFASLSSSLSSKDTFSEEIGECSLTQPTCSGDLSAYDAGWTDAFLPGSTHLDRCISDVGKDVRCFDVNDPCFQPLPATEKQSSRSVQAETVVLQEQDHRVHRYSSVRLPYGVKLEVHRKHMTKMMSKTSDTFALANRWKVYGMNYKLGVSLRGFQLHQMINTKLTLDDSRPHKEEEIFDAAFLTCGPNNPARYDCVRLERKAKAADSLSGNLARLHGDLQRLRKAALAGDDSHMFSQIPRYLSDAYDTVLRDMTDTRSINVQYMPEVFVKSVTKRRKYSFIIDGEEVEIESADDSDDINDAIGQGYLSLTSTSKDILTFTNNDKKVYRRSLRRGIGRMVYDPKSISYVEPFPHEVWKPRTTWQKEVVFTRRTQNSMAPIALVQFEKFQLPDLSVWQLLDIEFDLSGNTPNSVYESTKVNVLDLGADANRRFRKMSRLMGSFDPSYPSAIHADGHQLFMSFGKLRYLIEDKLNCPDSVVIHRRMFDRSISKQNTRVKKLKHHGGMHCTDPKNLRTLEDMLEPDGEKGANQPWMLLGKTYKDFKEAIPNLMPIMHVSFRNLIKYEHGDSDDEYENKRSYIENFQNDDYDTYPLFMPKDSRKTSENADAKIPSDYQTWSDSARVNAKYFAKILIAYAIEEAKLLYIMANWDLLSPHWFEVYRDDQDLIIDEHEQLKEGDNENKWFDLTPKNSPDSYIDTSSGFVAYNMSLQENFHCVRGSDRFLKTEFKAPAMNALCGDEQIAGMVGTNVVRCASCTNIKPRMCKGLIGCGAQSWVPESIPKVASTGNEISSRWLVEKAWNMIRDEMIIERTGLKTDAGIRNSKEDGSWAPFNVNKTADLFNGLFTQAPLAWDSWVEYNPLTANRYEQITGVLDASTSPPTIDVESCIPLEDAQEENFVDYTKCNMNKGVQHLNTSVWEKYMLQRGVLVHFNERVSWLTTKKQFTEKGAVPYWTDSARPARDQFVSWLLNDFDHCKYGGANRFNSVCHIDDRSHIHVFNPWLGGDFSVTDNCDDTKQYELGGGRRIDSKCSENICEGLKLSNFAQEQYTRDPAVGLSCWDEHGEPAGNIVVPDNVRFNLCEQLPRRNTTCSHAQGTLAGPGKPVDSLYEKLDVKDCLAMSTFQNGIQDVSTEKVKGGIFLRPRHKAFHGKTGASVSGKAGLFRVDEADIAGHHLRFELTDYGLRISDVMIQSYASLNEAEDQPAAGVDWLEYSVAKEDSLAAPTNNQGDWACPLRQQAFLTHDDKYNFNAIFPDGRRAKVLFSNLNDNTRVHPTQKAGSGATKIQKKYFSVNGVCACAEASQCRSKFSESDGCSFMGTVKSLYDNNWHDSIVKDFQKCKYQLDWPYTGGTLRDNSTIDTSKVDTSALSDCGLLSRLPVYRYRYKATNWIPADRDTPSTLDEDGDCHTGRLADTSGENIKGCEMSFRNESHLILQCSDTDGVFDREIILPRKIRDTPRKILQQVHSLRRRCSQCSATPTFHTASDTQIPAESSITHPYRVSSERRLAGNLRNDLARALCGNFSGCQSLDDILDQSQWVPEKFWTAFVGDVHHLLKNSTQLVNTSLTEVVQTRTDKSLDLSGEIDDKLWSEPWLFCSQAERVCDFTDVNGVMEQVCVNALTSEMTCTGIMDKKDWLDPTKRIEKTIKAFTETADQDDNLAQNMNVCDLDDTLSDLCKKMQAARSAVYAANCLASGKCFEELFFYQPSMFSLSNNKFVRQTVEAFYKETSSEVCIESTSARTDTLREQNGELAQKCGARFVNDIMKVVRLARLFAGAIVRSMYFTGMILFHAVRMVFPVDDVDDIMNDIRTYFDLLMEEIAGMVSALGEVVTEMIMSNTEMGKWLQELITTMCLFGEWVFKIFYLGVFCTIRSAVIDVLGAVIGLLSIGGGGASLETFKQKMELQQCDPSEHEDSSCTMIVDTASGTPDRVDAATRCWSSYVNSLGDSLSLSCSASDSCLYEGPDSVDGLIVCDSCPAPIAFDFSQYNCDTVRKQCKCGVQSITRSACINHGQCTANADPSATCDMLDTSFEVLPYATSPCDTCISTALCVEAAGGARCTCANRRDAFEGCSMHQRGKTIVPDSGGLCLVTMGELVTENAAVSMDYVLNYDELAAAPCDFVDSSQSFCMLVFTSREAYSYYVVGLQTLNFGNRRLLSDSDENKQTSQQRGHNHISSIDLQQVAQEPWQHVLDDGCRMVAQQVQNEHNDLNHSTDLSVSDTVLYTSCLRWRAIGEDVRQTYNLSVNNTFLLSTRDMTEALKDVSLFFGLIRRPDMIPYIFLHTEAAAPVRAIVRSIRIWVYHHIGWMKSQTEALKWLLLSNSTKFDQKNNASSILSNLTDYSKIPTKLYTTQNLRNELMQAASPLLSSPLADEILRKTDDSHEEDIVELADWVDETIESIQDDPESKKPIQMINRRLLVFQDSMDAVRKYSVQLSLGNGATQLLGAKLADDLSQIPIAFPPISINWDEEAECTAATQLWSVLTDCSSLMYKYYAALYPGTPPNKVVRGILKSFPSLTTQRSDDQASGMNQETFASMISNELFEKLLFISPDAVRHKMMKIPGLVKKFMVCDINTVMFCSEFRYSLFSSIVVVAALTYAVALILSTIGVPYVWTLVALLYMPLVFFYAFGISPFCTPMLPTCLGKEILTFLDLIIPQKISWPQPLQRTPNCIDNPEITASDCIVSCEAIPFVYKDWAEPLAWGMCDISLTACTVIQKWLAASSFLQGIDQLKSITEALDRSARVLQGTDEEMKTAFRLCAALESWKSIPILLLTGLSVYAIPIVVMLPVYLLTSVMQLGMSSLLLSHMRWTE